MGCQPSSLHHHHIASSADSPPQIEWHDRGVIGVAELRQLLATGDMLFFSGNTLLARLIRCSTWFHYSHVALVDTAYNAHTGQNEVFLLESVRHDDGVLDVLSARARCGTRLCELGARIDAAFRTSNSGSVYLDVCVVKLVHTGGAAMRERLVSQLRAFERVVCNRPYESHLLSIARAQFPTFLLESKDASSSACAGEYFCSKLVADALRFMDVLPHALEPERFTPAMLARAATTFHNRWGPAAAHYEAAVYCYSVRMPSAADTQQQHPPPQPAQSALDFYTPASPTNNWLALMTSEAPPPPQLQNTYQQAYQRSHTLGGTELLPLGSVDYNANASTWGSYRQE